MRILVAHSGNMYGGLERALDTFAQAPAYCPGASVDFALCFDGPAAQSLRANGADPLIVGGVRMTRPDQVLRARRRFAQVLRDTAPDVVITPAVWTHTLFAPVVRKAGLPLVHWVHDELTGSTWLERLAARHQPDLLICNSQFSLRAARTVFPRVDGTVVYCPLLFADAGRTRADVRRAMGTRADAIVLVNVARMTPLKGQLTLVEALAHLGSAAEWECWMVGGAQQPDEQAHLQQVQAAVAGSTVRERVRMLGHRTDVQDLLEASDLYCHPNRGVETFGFAIVEAMHAGLPVVASGAGGPAEIVTPDCGRMVPAGDVPALAAALHALLADDAARTRMAAAGRVRAAALCDAPARFTEFTSALEGLRARMAA